MSEIKKTAPKEPEVRTIILPSPDSCNAKSITLKDINGTLQIDAADGWKIIKDKNVYTLIASEPEVKAQGFEVIEKEIDKHAGCWAIANKRDSAFEDFKMGALWFKANAEKFLAGQKSQAATLRLPEKIISALEFYADPESWSRRTSGHGESSCDVIKDDGGYESVAGKRAREVLSEFYAVKSMNEGG